MKVSSTFSGTVNVLSDLLTLVTASSSPRRFKLYDLIIGADGAPADAATRWEIRRKTAVATAGTAAAPLALDISDTVATTLVGTGNPSANGTGTTVIMGISLNQRASFRWVASPGGELIAPATASNGYSAFPNGAAPALVATTVTFFADEL